MEPVPEKRYNADKLMDYPIFQGFKYYFIKKDKMFSIYHVLGWRVAIDEQHQSRATQPSSALFLFPFVSVLSFSSSGPSLCFSNLQFISSWLVIFI